jgi:hypothetical protein
MPGAPSTITLGGASYEVRLPRSFADREAIHGAFVQAGTVVKSKKATAACVALCVPAVAAMVTDTPDSCGDDLFVYGDRVYDALREKGVRAQEITDAARLLGPVIFEGLYPRAAEVKKAEDFTEAGA